MQGITINALCIFEVAMIKYGKLTPARFQTPLAFLLHGKQWFPAKERENGKFGGMPDLCVSI